jgi:hypothetical protein
VEQWELFDDGTGRIDAAMVRQISVGSETEGMVTDEEEGWLYASEEAVGIWRYGAEPDDGSNRTLVAMVDNVSGPLHADVEGLTIYYASGGEGYLIASSQGNDTFVVYGRQPPNPHVMTFEIGTGGGVDKTTFMDGIDVTNVPFGPAFPFGVFISHDDHNQGANQNFKLVPWERIASSLDPPLLIDTTPRAFSAPVPDNCNCPPGDCSGLDDVCTIGACNAATSHCEAQPTNEGGECDDGDPCVVNETCQAGSCSGIVLPDTDGDGSCDAIDEDDDDDGFNDADDCAPLDGENWRLPGEAADLSLAHTGGVPGTTVLSWTAPAVAGGTSLVYSALVSPRPDDFINALSCLKSGDGLDTAATDTSQQPPGTLRYFLVRAENGCGAGPLGQSSDGTPRSGGACP